MRDEGTALGGHCVRRAADALGGVSLTRHKRQISICLICDKNHNPILFFLIIILRKAYLFK